MCANCKSTQWVLYFRRATLQTHSALRPATDFSWTCVVYRPNLRPYHWSVSTNNTSPRFLKWKKNQSKQCTRATLLPTCDSEAWTYLTIGAKCVLKLVENRAVIRWNEATRIIRKKYDQLADPCCARGLSDSVLQIVPPNSPCRTLIQTNSFLVFLSTYGRSSSSIVLSR